MTDRELLELAAKAAGIKGSYASLDEYPDWMTVHDGEGVYYTSSQAWNPLQDDGDALRLAVKLGLLVDVSLRGEEAEAGGADVPYQVERFMDNANDPYAATRRAIVRAAAEIWREK